MIKDIKMIQKFLLPVMTLLAMFFFSACGQKASNLDAPKGRNNVSDATQIAGETVAINENTYGNENNKSANQNVSSNESNSDTLNGSNVNSSSDGFKSLYFGFGGYGIAPSMENRMTLNAQVASKTSKKIKIEGNCDEFGTDEYNYALGLKRAKAVKDNMIAQGVSATKMVIVSYGESSPVCSSPTDGCYARNRRVDLHLVK